MQKSDNIDENIIVKELSNVASTAFQELELTKQNLKEKELELKEIAEISNQKINAAVKTNQDLQTKVQMLMDLSNTLEKENEILEQKNIEFKVKENTFNKLNKDLKDQLVNISKDEKDLELRKKYLEKQVELKTDALLKSEKMAIIGELTSKLAHDLRNPLSVIKAAHGLMKEKPKMEIEKRLQYNSRIDRSLLRIIHLVDDVLGFVRISDLELVETSVLSLLESSIDSIDIPEKVKIIKPENDFQINCDYRKIEAVFANLITNSIQAVDGDGRIEMRMSDTKNGIKIEIEDSGSGIAKSIMPKIYDPLFTTKTSGTGLGLAICKTIVEQHDGTISAKSNPTTFTILLPTNL